MGGQEAANERLTRQTRSNGMSNYAALFRKVTWPHGPLEVEFESGETPPAEALISNINAVPFTGPDQWVVIQL
jgi:hypothetical protein